MDHIVDSIAFSHPDDQVVEDNDTIFNWNGSVDIIKENDHDNNSKGIQEWTVPADGIYSIKSLGASGGSTNGGNGATIFGKFQFTKDKQLKILIGQKGITSGGGGGSGWNNLTVHHGGFGGGAGNIQDDNSVDSNITGIQTVSGVPSSGGGGGGNGAGKNPYGPVPAAEVGNSSGLTDSRGGNGGPGIIIIKW